MNCRLCTLCTTSFSYDTGSLEGGYLAVVEAFKMMDTCRRSLIQDFVFILCKDLLPPLKQPAA